MSAHPTNPPEQYSAPVARTTYEPRPGHFCKAGRTLYDYHNCITPRPLSISERASVAKVLGARMWDVGKYLKITAMLGNMAGAVEPRKPVHWVDLGTGTGFAQHEIIQIQSWYPEMRSVELTGVDIQPYELSFASLQRLYGDKAARRKPHKDHPKPHFVLGDAATVQLPKHADLITSVFSVPYWDDPVGGLANAYNQLKDNGLLIIATDASYEWTRGIRYAPSEATVSSPITDITAAFEGAGIQYAALSAGGFQATSSMYEDEPPGKHYCTLFVRRRPGTTLRLLGSLAGSPRLYPEGSSREDFKITEYARQEVSGTLVEVAAA